MVIRGQWRPLLAEVPPPLTTHDSQWLPHMSIKQQPCLDYGSDRRPSFLIWLTPMDLFHRYTSWSSVSGINWAVSGQTETHLTLLCGSFCAFCLRKHWRMFIIRRWNNWRRVGRALKNKKRCFHSQAVKHKRTIDVIPFPLRAALTENPSKWCQESISRLMKWAAASSISSSDSTSYSG